MRTITFLFAIFLFTLNTNAQKSNIMEYFRNIPVISAEHEILDRSLFSGVASIAERDSINTIRDNRQRFIQRRNQWTQEERDSMRNVPSINTPMRMRSYTERDQNGMVRKRFSGFTTNRVVGREFLNPYIYIYRDFHPNDGLRRKVLGTVFGFQMGKRYHFDEEGNLIEVIDHEEGFEFTPEDIIAFCLKYGIDLHRRSMPSNPNPTTRIFRRIEEDDKAVWVINYLDFDARPITSNTIIIDGKTGNVIRKYERGFE